MTPYSKKVFLPIEQQPAYILRWKAGDKKAGEELFKSYEGFIHQFLKKQFGKRLDAKNYNDALSAACIGFFKAVENFDPSKNVRIGTYSVFWMRAEVSEMLRLDSGKPRANAKAIGIQKEMRRELSLSSRQSVPLSVMFERVSARLNIDVDNVRKKFEMASLQTVSLDTPLGSRDGNFMIADMIADNAEPLHDMILSDDDGRILRDAIDQLTPRLKTIICSRFGLAAAGGITKTLDEIGAEMGITRERVRQLETQAKNKLKIILTETHFNY